jgi:hypothetical protein
MFYLHHSGTRDETAPSFSLLQFKTKRHQAFGSCLLGFVALIRLIYATIKV